MTYTYEAAKRQPRGRLVFNPGQRLIVGGGWYSDGEVAVKGDPPEGYAVTEEKAIAEQVIAPAWEDGHKAVPLASIDMTDLMDPPTPAGREAVFFRVGRYAVAARGLVAVSRKKLDWVIHQVGCEDYGFWSPARGHSTPALLLMCDGEPRGAVAHYMFFETVQARALAVIMERSQVDAQ